MNWLPSFIVLAIVARTHQQCFTPQDDFDNTTYSTDLSGITDFALDLFKELSVGGPAKGVFFSPYSVWNALILAYLGSAGNTQKELESVLRVKNKVSTIKLWRALNRLYDMRQENNQQYAFSIANRAYFDTSVQLTSCIQDALSEELRILDFTDGKSSASAINGFVSETTRGLIKSIVQPGDLANALMVLVNAAYFKGNWQYEFRAAETYQGIFYAPDGPVPASMMPLEANLRYGESKALGARVLELPYSGDVMSMYILLPSSEGPALTRFATMVENLNGKTLKEAISPLNLMLSDVDVHVPKFKVEQEFSGELLKALTNLGLEELFQGHLANLTSFSPYGDLTVSKVVHKSFVDINEEGTEAAAVTSLITRYTAIDFSTPIRFHCREPFVYIIYDNQTNNVLFVGSFKGPNGL